MIRATSVVPMLGITPSTPVNMLTASAQALLVQDILKNNVVTTILSGTPAMFTSGMMTTTARLYTGQIVMTQAGKTATVSSTVQVDNRQLTQQQVLKQYTILKQNQSSRDLPFPPMLVGLPPPAR